MLYVRAPNHLGDGVMALPAIEALRRIDRVTVAAPAWGEALYGHLDVALVPRGTVPKADAAVLFPPSFRAAWEARRLPRRIGFKSDWRGWLLTDALAPSQGHRSQGYAALAKVLGAVVDGPPTLPVPEGDTTVPDGHLALVPVSPSGEPVMWRGFEQLGQNSRWPVVVYTGPGESWPTQLPTRAGLSIPQLTRALVRARAVVSNDSGVAHLARALGVRTLVVHGSTVAHRTGPAGSEAIVGPRLDCAPCYAKRCSVGGAPCLDIAAAQVEGVLYRS